MALIKNGPLKKAIAIVATLFVVIGIGFSVFKGLFSPELEGTKTKQSKPKEVVLSSSQEKINVEISDKINVGGGELSIEIAGEKVNFSLKEINLNRFALPDKDALYLYEKLSEKAINGDVVASRLLGDFLSRCQSVFGTLEEHNNSLKRLREEGKFPSTDPYISNIDVDEKMVAQLEKQTIREFNSCKGLSLEQKNESSKWSKIASDGGDFLGLEALLKDSTINGVERYAVLKKQWDDFGYLDGLNGLTTVLSGFGVSQEFEGVEPDPKLAYAYFLVTSRINVAARERSQPFVSTTLGGEYDQFESLLTSSLTAQEHLEAEQIAIELIRSNPNCCVLDTRPTVSISED